MVHRLSDITRRAFNRGAIATGLSLITSGRALSAPPQSAPDVWKYLGDLPAAEHSKVVEAEAAREGKLVLSGALGIDRAQFLINAFNEKYPNIKTEFVRLTQTDTLTRTVAEARAGKVSTDLVISTTTYLDLLKDTLAPYQPSSWNDWDKRFLFGSNADGWTSIVYELLPTTIAWRTDRGISRDAAPKTLLEVEDQKWKGRTGCTTQLEEFIYSMIAKYGEADAFAQVDRLAALDNQMVASNAALAENLGSGQIDVAWNFVAHRAYYLLKKGAPIDWVFMEPQFAQGVGLSATKGAPNPYSAALFMDFLLEAETMEKLDRLEAGRIFGNKKGKYQISTESFPDMMIYPPIAPAEFKRLNTYVEEKFVRRKKG